MGTLLVLVGFFVVMGFAVQYFLTIAKETVPVNPWPHIAIFGGGALVAVLGAILDPNVVTILLAVTTAATGIFLIWLLGQRRVPDGELIVEVSDPFPELIAPNQNGKMIDISDLLGQRILFKFFRGSW